MLGLDLDRVPKVLKTREIEECLNELLADVLEGDEVWLITPYATMKQLSSQRRAIAEAVKRGGKISFVVRDEPDQVNPAKSDLEEAISLGLNLYSFHRLHAKAYWFAESACIVTSANLVDGSFEDSTEIGLMISPGKLHSQIREWIKETIEPGLTEIKKGRIRKDLLTPRRDRSAPGHCIRCNSEVRFNVDKPYCFEHFRSWARYSNPDYKENFCHRCGKEVATTKSKPVCYSCYKR